MKIFNLLLILMRLCNRKRSQRKRRARARRKRKREYLSKIGKKSGKMKREKLLEEPMMSTLDNCLSSARRKRGRRSSTPRSIR